MQYLGAWSNASLVLPASWFDISNELFISSNKLPVCTNEVKDTLERTDIHGHQIESVETMLASDRIHWHFESKMLSVCAILPKIEPSASDLKPLSWPCGKFGKKTGHIYPCRGRPCACPWLGWHGKTGGHKARPYNKPATLEIIL